MKYEIFSKHVLRFKYFGKYFRMANESKIRYKVKIIAFQTYLPVVDDRMNFKLLLLLFDEEVDEIFNRGLMAEDAVVISEYCIISCVFCGVSASSSASFGFTFNCGRTTPKYYLIFKI